MSSDYTPIPEGYKRCKGCGKILPATLDYFYKNGGRYKGLRGKCRLCMNSENRKWLLDNVEKKKEIDRKWRENNPGHAKRWIKDHPDREKGYRHRYWLKVGSKIKNQRLKSWRNKNPESAIASAHRRRAILLSAQGTHTAEDIRILMEQSKGHCYWCGKKIQGTPHVDHRIPLSRGGSNDASNLVITCAHCNVSKHNKMPYEWNGRLL